MAAITVRDVPNETRDELAARASRHGRSLQEFLRLELIRLASKPDPTALADRIADRKRRTGATLTGAQILAFRDDDRR